MGRYTISRASRFLNISNESLRNYERRGLVSPERESNGYRYFTQRDLDKLQGIHRFRNMGFSMNEIEELMLTADSARVTELLSGAAARLREEQLWAAELERAAFRVADDWRHIGERLGRCELTESPEILRVSMRYNADLTAP